MAARATSFCLLLLALSAGCCQSRSLTTGNRSGSTTDVPQQGLMSQEIDFPAPTAATSNLPPEDDDGIAGTCRLTTRDPYVHNRVVQMLTEESVTLIEYRLNFTNYTHNPLTINVANAYDANKWSRVTTAHGQTLLSLAFNYGVLSMMTLTLGTQTLHVELQDWPFGCMAAANDSNKIDSVRRLLMRDFNADGPITTVDEGRVCHQVIINDNGYAKFRHDCCFKDSITGKIECTNDISNFWLNLLYSMLGIVRFGLLCFGPSLFISAVLSISKDNVPYIVRLKSKLEKTVCFYRGDPTDFKPVTANRILDLSKVKGFPKLQESVRDSEFAIGEPVKVRFPQYDINVDYNRMLKENTVPVGLFYSLFNQVFKCEMRYLGPFWHCCKSRMFPNRFLITWGKFCKKVAKVLLILFIPAPFYLRLVIFYVFEYEEVQKRKEAIEIGGMQESFENSVMHYFTPTHGVFIFIYIMYVITAIILAFLSQKGKDHRVKKIIVNSFRELKGLNFTDTLSMIVSNVVWPLENFGALGCCVGIIYWPVSVIGSLVVGVFYFIPTLYLTVRMAYHSKLAAVVRARQPNTRMYKVRVRPDQDMYRFQTENVLSKFRKTEMERREYDISMDDLDHIIPSEHLKEDAISIKSSLLRYPTFSWARVMKYVVCAFICILTLYSVVFILSEVIGCLVEILVFTIMGCIVNAGALLKYVMLLLMVIVYCGDCFSSMEKKYLKMNKALFNELKYRIKDLDKVTSLLSHYQENFGFKAQELNEQADYEASDDVARKPPKHWMINDLVLFVDSEDTPRIPKQLFDEVIQIRVAGVPGPVYRGLMAAFRDLSKMLLFLLFVFIVILSFGAVHQISATNQSLATLIVGSLPRMMRMFLAPPRPDVELGTVSFRSKMDEVIKNFCQYWPIYDLPFEVVKEEDGDEGRNDENKVVEDSKPQQTLLVPGPRTKVDAIRDNYSSNNNSLQDLPSYGKDGVDTTVVEPLLVPLSAVVNKVEAKDATKSTDVDIIIYLPPYRDSGIRPCSTSI